MILLRCEAGLEINLDVRLSYRDGWLTGDCPWMGHRNTGVWALVAAIIAKAMETGEDEVQSSDG